jgi:hypothetical protein
MTMSHILFSFLKSQKANQVTLLFCLLPRKMFWTS